MTRGLQFTRQWKLLAYLATRKFGATLGELAEELGYHARTVRRDVGMLREVGFPIEYVKNSRTREVRVLVAESYRTPMIPFTLTEVMSIYFAGNLLKSLRGTPMKAGFDSAVAKIEKTLPMHVLEYADDVQNKLVTKTGPLKDYKAHVETLDRLRQAIADKRKLEIDYRAYGRTKSERHFYHPYCMAFANSSIYAIGHSESRNAMRTLLVDRIEAARFINEHFICPSGFDADKYLEDSFGVWREDATQEVKIEFSREVAQLIREREWHPSQRLAEGRNGRVILTMRVNGLPEVVTWVLSFGHQAKALAPTDLVQQVHGQIILAGGLYRTSKTTPRTASRVQT